MNFAHLPRCIIYLYAFLGPLGNILCPRFFPYQFRTFYLILPLCFLFYAKIYKKEFQTLLTFSPFFIYSLISSYFCINRPDLHNETSMCNRSILFVCEVFFMFGAAFYLRDRPSFLEKNRLIRFYLYGFFFSLFTGYILFIGYYAQVIPLHLIDRFTVITQFGWGILRFSPGSYANEYGIVSSFVASILLLLIVEKDQPNFQIGFSKKILYPFFALTFLGLLLTTTRAAYLSFFFAIVYIFWISKNFRFILCYLSLGMATFFLLFGSKLKWFITVVLNAFKLQGYAGHSIQTRLCHWLESVQAFIDFPLFGRGFGSLFYIHNVYLELFSELGLVGSLTLIFFGVAYFTQHHKMLKRLFFQRWSPKQEVFSNRAIVLGLMHVFWFAATNHNMNHHLTWMVFLLLNITLFTTDANKKIDDTSLPQKT